MPFSVAIEKLKECGVGMWNVENLHLFVTSAKEAELQYLLTIKSNVRMKCRRIYSLAWSPRNCQLNLSINPFVNIVQLKNNKN